MMFQVEQPSGEILPIREEDLDEDLRRGRIDPRRRVSHPEHTEGQLRPIVEVPRLSEATSTPNARLAAMLWRKTPAWLCHVLVGLVVVIGLPQVVLGAVGHEELLDSVWRFTATGFDPLVLDRYFWTPWTTQLSHAGPAHLAGNVAVLAWCGYRVERATGAFGTLLVWSTAVALGALCIVLFEDRPVVGSSIAAFGVWGAQIALGFRFADGMHPRWHKFYGYGNLAVFAFLFAGTFRGGDLVSHWGHAGGLLGGVLAAFVVRPWSWPLSGALISVSTALVLLLGPVYRLALPSLPSEPTTAEGVVLQLPVRMADARGSYTWVSAWTSNPGGNEYVFAGELRMDWRSLEEGDLIWGPDLVYWLDDFGVEATLVDEPEVIAPGWNVTAVSYEQDGVRYRHVEHHLVQGVWLNRVGYVVREGAEVREGWYDGIVRGVEVNEPVALLEARQEYERNPNAERLTLDYARALRNAGQAMAADALLKELVTTGTQRKDESALVRIQLWGLNPMLFEPDRDPQWFEPFLAETPGDGDLARDAVRWLVYWERCDQADAVAAALRERWPWDATVTAVVDNAASCSTP